MLLKVYKAFEQFAWRLPSDLIIVMALVIAAINLYCVYKIAKEWKLL